MSEYNFIEFDPNNRRDNTITYLALLANCMNGRAEAANGGSSVNINDVIDHIAHWLTDSTDFFTAPASTQYHEAYPGGLLAHTLNVYNKIVELGNLPSFSSVNMDSAVFVALTHDWCKINYYESYFKNVKDSQGNWTQVQAFKTRKDTINLGHGVQSLVMVCQLCCTEHTKLSQDEMAAIRWHMYTYDVTSYDIGGLNNCNNAIPLVHMLQFADQLAITNY